MSVSSRISPAAWPRCPRVSNRCSIIPACFFSPTCGRAASIDSTRLPVLLVGGMAGNLDTGRVLDFAGRSDGDRKLCSLYLSLMDRMDVKADRFGDATARLAGL